MLAPAEPAQGPVWRDSATILVDRPRLIAGRVGGDGDRLAAEGAVFGAEAALGVAQDVDPHVAPMVPRAQAEGGVE
jgi:hypothetical protein